MILIIDNYDSFTYNIVQGLGELGTDTIVYRNDKISMRKIIKINPEKIIISPGPCTPLESGISNEVIKCFQAKKPILGICLGHQCIGHVFGGRIIRAPRAVHGKLSTINHDSLGLYKGIPSNFHATRYHSLIVDKETLPECLKISAVNEENLIMGIRHKEFPIEGVQWHPESIMTKIGLRFLKNFIDL